MFVPELAALTARLPRLRVQTYVTKQTGRIGVDTLRPYAGSTTRVHLCGPAPMMQDLIGHLTELGVPREAIHTEAFVSGRSQYTPAVRRRTPSPHRCAAGGVNEDSGSTWTMMTTRRSRADPGSRFSTRRTSPASRCRSHVEKAPAVRAGYGCSPAPMTRTRDHMFSAGELAARLAYWRAQSTRPTATWTIARS